MVIQHTTTHSLLILDGLLETVCRVLLVHTVEGFDSILGALSRLVKIFDHISMC